MAIVHKAAIIHKNADGFDRWAFPNTPDNPAYVPTIAEPQIPTEGTHITDVDTEFFEEVREIYNIYSGHLSEDRTMERIKTCSWGPSWRKDVIEYCHSFVRCHKANKATGRIYFLMIHIQEPNTPWEVVHMDWLTSLPPGGDKSCN
ncbi:hypothetical protein O181_111602 [Austropuccinia psidii MF-1]|uniref:Integrase zinc-binding domain-containing protein n=1 Tax=Austropuccinia psidii MF-1 TaxID=1389203 RepID=A0A9Q3K079_9BASI|nr:hypothetical protein [Austropuccinia psidii MF-1]